MAESSVQHRGTPVWPALIAVIAAIVQEAGAAIAVGLFDTLGKTSEL
jgi:threonine/homoserine efflux transporter RhtA